MPLSYLAFPLDGSSHLPTSLNNFILPFVFSTKCLAHCHFPLWYTHISYYYILFYFPEPQDRPKVENQKILFLILALACSVTLMELALQFFSLQNGNENIMLTHLPELL